MHGLIKYEIHGSNGPGQPIEKNTFWLHVQGELNGCQLLILALESYNLKERLRVFEAKYLGYPLPKTPTNRG